MKARVSLQEPHNETEAKRRLLHVSKTKLAATMQSSAVRIAAAMQLEYVVSAWC